MKQLLVTLLAVTLLFCLTACGNQDVTADNTTATTVADTSVTENTTTVAETTVAKTTTVAAAVTTTKAKVTTTVKKTNAPTTTKKPTTVKPTTTKKTDLNPKNTIKAGNRFEGDCFGNNGGSYFDCALEFYSLDSVQVGYKSYYTKEAWATEVSWPFDDNAAQVNKNGKAYYHNEYDWHSLPVSCDITDTQITVMVSDAYKVVLTMPSANTLKVVSSESYAFIPGSIFTRV